MPTFTLIMPAVVVGSGGAASIDFTTIPSTYTDLVLVFSTRTSAASASGNDILSINGSLSSFSGRRLYGSGSSAASDTVTTWSGFTDANTATASTFGNTAIYFTNYAGSTNKSYSIDTVQEQNGTTAYMGLAAGLWSNSAAINRLTLTPDSGNYVQYSTAYLYGVSNA